MGGIGRLPLFFGRERPFHGRTSDRYPYDTEAGTALLEEVGWRDHDSNPATPRVAQGITNVPDGTELSVNFWATTSTQRRRVANYIQDMLDDCGIEVTTDFFSAGDFFGSEEIGGIVFGRTFDLAQFAWLTDALPPCELFLSDAIPGPPETLDGSGKPRYRDGWDGSNNPGFANEAYDEACRTAMSTLPGEPGFVNAQRLAQEIFARELPVIPFYTRVQHAFSRVDFCNYPVDPTAGSDFWNIEEYNYGTGCG